MKRKHWIAVLMISMLVILSSPFHDVSVYAEEDIPEEITESADETTETAEAETTEESEEEPETPEMPNEASEVPKMPGDEPEEPEPGNDFVVIDKDGNTVAGIDELKEVETTDGVYLYYFDAEGNAARNMEIEYPAGTFWYFEDNGHAVKNAWNPENLKYYGSEGKRLSGTARIGRYYYCFDEITGEKLTNRFKEISDSYCVYYDKDGHLVFGTMKIGGYYYCFNETNGNMIRNQFVDINANYRVYYDKDGHLVFGTQQISSDYYFFDLKNGNMAKNKFVDISPDYRVYYDGNGHLVKGARTIGGYTYFFNTSSGKMYRKQFVSSSGKKVYYDSSGHLAKGRVMAYDGEWYYFNSSDGNMITGWVWFSDLGYSVHYDTKTGRLARGTVTINGVKHTFASNGKGQPDIKWIKNNVSGTQLKIKVNRAQNVVTVYTKDYQGKFTIPVKAFVCSTGKATPLGTYNTFSRSRWMALYGGVYGQYATAIVRDILFHSVPYYSMSVSNLEYYEYNKLGKTASMGCVRLCVRDAKWIYDNCPIGISVTFYDDANNPGPLGKPKAIKIGTGDSRRGWDPTDPNSANPWR